MAIAKPNQVQMPAEPHIEPNSPPFKSEYTEFKLSYSSRHAWYFLLVLVGIEVLLTVSHLVIHVFYPHVPWGPLRRLANMGSEVSVATWFSTIQLLAVGFVSLLIGIYTRSRRHFLAPAAFAVGIGFIFLSMDEASAIHESITIILKHFDMTWFMFRDDHGGWVAVYLVLGLLIFVLSYRRFLRPLWDRYRREALLMAAGFVLFLVGAVGIEVISYHMHGMSSEVRSLAGAIEEFLEMFGISVTLYGSMMLGLTLSGELKHTP